MAPRLCQHKSVFLTCALVTFSVVRNSSAGVSERNITSAENHVVHYTNNETLGTESTTEFPDARANRRIESSHSDDAQQDYTTSTSNSDLYFDDYSADSNDSEQTSVSENSLADYNTSTKALEPGKYLYPWDKTQLSFKQFQESCSPYRCQNGHILKVNESSGYCTYFLWFPCNCEQPACLVYGICCPDISVPYLSQSNSKVQDSRKTDQISHISDSKVDDNVTAQNSSGSEAKDKYDNEDFNTSKELESTSVQDVQTYPKIGCHETQNVLYIRSCLAHIQVSNEVIQKCEADIPESETGVDSFALATDESTNVVYYNKFCAECNGVKQTQIWDVEVMCDDFMKLYKARSRDEFLRLALDERPGCSIKQKSPFSQQPVVCDQCWFAPPKVNTSNVTGLWHHADEDVVAGCTSLTMQNPKYWVMASDWLYENIFCAICNERDYPSPSECLPLVCEPPMPPYSILFNLRDKSPTKEWTVGDEGCSSTEWSSPDGLCVPADCAPGKILIDGNCSTAVTQITYLRYRLRLLFILNTDNVTEIKYAADVPPSQYALDMFSSKLISILSPSVEYAELSYGVLLNASTMKTLGETDSNTQKRTPFKIRFVSKLQDYSLRVPHLYWVTGHMAMDGGTNRDTFEQTILEKIFNEELYLNFTDQISVGFRPVQMWHDFNITTYCEDIEKQNNDIKCFLEQDCINFPLADFYFPSETSSALDLSINFTRTLTCKFVSFPRSQYLIETDYKHLLPNVTIKLLFNTTQLTIANESDFSKMSVDENGELNICCDFLDERIASMPHTREKERLIKTVQYFLTFVCMGVSMLCLLLTIVMYVRFAVLRSVAGRNNLCLCLSLFLAQASLLASFFTNTESVVCVPLGMLTHFLWLNLFAWNFLCCLYMYKVFGAKTRNMQTTPRTQNVSLFKNVAFSLLAPAVVVSAVVVGAYVTSGGRSLGYGGSVCYLNDRILVAAATVAPVILITIANISLFLMTVYNIHGVAKLQKFHTSKKDDQHNAYIYVKLSSVTGAFWVTFIAAELSDLDALRIVAIILNGLQGLFIFISFVCNKRVLMLYLPPRPPKINNTTRTNSNSTTKDFQRNGQHELLPTPSLSLVGETARGSMGCANRTMVGLDGSFGSPV